MRRVVQRSLPLHGRLPRSEMRQAVQELDALWPVMFRLAVTETLVRLAGDLATMVTWDLDLARAAAAEGLAVIPPLVP